MQRILDYNYKENIFLVDNEFNCMLEIAYKITKYFDYVLNAKFTHNVAHCDQDLVRFTEIIRTLYVMVI